MIQREILGPQEQFERSGAQGLRDVRVNAATTASVASR